MLKPYMLDRCPQLQQILAEYCYPAELLTDDPLMGNPVIKSDFLLFR